MLERKSCLRSEMPPVNGTAKRFLRNVFRRFSFASIVSSSACLAATTAPIYFTKLIPHFSHFTPVRCLLPQEGHSKRIVMWQRWQKRATSRTAAPHLGQGIVACGIGAAVGSHLSEGCSAGDCALDVLDVLGDPDFALGASPLTGPEDELLVIAHFNWAAGGLVRRIGSCVGRVTPVRGYRLVCEYQSRQSAPPLNMKHSVAENPGTANFLVEFDRRRQADLLGSRASARKIFRRLAIPDTLCRGPSKLRESYATRVAAQSPSDREAFLLHSASSVGLRGSRKKPRRF